MVKVRRAMAARVKKTIPIAKTTATTSKPVVKNGEEVWIQLSQLERSNPSTSRKGEPTQCQAEKTVIPSLSAPPPQG